jgi:L-2,4-diaminobutyrate decarboxylase
VPSLSTAVLFRDARRSHEALAQSAAYLLDDSAQNNWWDGARRTIECTRRLLSLPLYTLLACCGEEALIRHVETLHASAERFAMLVQETKGFRLAIAPESNIVCFRCEPEGCPDEELDALQIRLRETIVREGSFFIVRTTLRGRVWLRCTLMNPATSEADMRALLARLRQLATTDVTPAEA